MIQIHPYLTLNGHSEAAMKFYQQCLGGDLNLMKVKESPMASEWPKDTHEKILHGSLTNADFVLLCTDMGDPQAKMSKGNTLSLSIEFDTMELLHQTFKSLSEEGQVCREPHEFFGGTIAVLTDKFGIDWTFYHHKIN